MILKFLFGIPRLLTQERGSEITEQIFWIGLIILAVILLLPQLRGVLMGNLQSLIDALAK
jgi:hypothetical protein